MECCENLPGLELYGEDALEVGVGTTSFRHILSAGGPGSLTFWGEDLGFVRGDVQESGGGTHGVPKVDNRTEGVATEGRDLAAGVRR